jgi:beta-lactamase superfamily II metal-dependent hydrolase
MEKIICTDLANVFTEQKKGEYITTFAYGDVVDVIEEKTEYVKIKVPIFTELKDGSIKPGDIIDGYIKTPKAKNKKLLADKDEIKILKVDFVDVQQGDGIVIESPEGKIVLIDGGDNQLFARYLANRYKGSSPTNLKKIDCIVISHGDADHFEGLTEIFKSRDYPNPEMPYKKLFIHPERVFHNGLVKRPGKIDGVALKDEEMFGETVKKNGKTIITDLVDDLRKVDDKLMNEPFGKWKKAIEAYTTEGSIEYKRIAEGDDKEFDFLKNENIEVNVLGPLITKVDGKDGLEFLGPPKKTKSLDVEETDSKGSLSASHTINGHSIVLKLKFGNVNFLFAGDLNEESENKLKNSNIKSEVFKVPHHGSADFSGDFLEAVSPVISVVSSGDENARKEYIHPRATLMAMLGKHSRTTYPVIFVTELVAFFEMVGYVQPEIHKQTNNGLVEIEKKKKLDKFFAFKRTAFGIVKIRTDGNRLLVYTNSGQDKMKEAYAFEIDQSGNAESVDIIKV